MKDQGSLAWLLSLSSGPAQHLSASLREGAFSWLLPGQTDALQQRNGTYTEASPEVVQLQGNTAD